MRRPLYCMHWLLLLQLIALTNPITAVRLNRQSKSAVLKQKASWCSALTYHKVNRDQSDMLFLRSHCGENANATYGGLSPRAIFGMRREFRCMARKDRLAYMNALNKMKTTMVGEISEYDNFVVIHDGKNSKPAHFGPGFFGWHREFLAGFERGVRSYCPKCMQPYWDSRLDKRLGGDPADSVYFSEYLLGNARGEVVTGFAAKWSIPSSYCRLLGPRLKRNLTKNTYYFYDDDDVNSANNVDSFKSFTYPWNEFPEMSHGSVHLAFGIGSHMLDVLCSPSDPVFFQHHAFVDLIFERARQNILANGSLVYPDTSPSNLPRGYDDSNGHIEIDSAGDAPMLPFEGLDNEHGLVSASYTDDIYNYERTPGDVECRQASDCCDNGNVEFLWCDRTGRCVSKAKRGGRIHASFPASACYCATGRPVVVNSVCNCR